MSIAALRAGQLRHLANLSSLLYDIEPDIAGVLLSNTGPDTGGRAANSQNCTLVIAASTRPRWVNGKLKPAGIVAYTTVGAPVSLVATPPSASKASWLDPRTGEMHKATGAPSNSGAEIVYTPPVATKKQGNDWVLIVGG